MTDRDRCGVCSGRDGVTTKTSVAIPGVSIPMCGECRGSEAEPWDTVVFVTAIGLSPQLVEHWRRHVSTEWEQTVNATLEHYGRDESEFLVHLWEELALQMPDY